MPHPNLICLVIDRLHAGYLGAYGNAWVRTPAFDRLASESFLFERAMIDSPDLQTAYRSLWTGLHAMCPHTYSTQRLSLPSQFTAARWPTTLVTDDQAVAEHPLAADFSDRVLLPSSGKPSSLAESVDQTDAAAFFAAAGDAISNLRPPFALWLHTATLARAWDAPLEYRKRYVDEEDPNPGDWATPPARVLPEDFDPDERVTLSHAYAGQVTLLDELLGSLLEAIDETGRAGDTTLVLTSTRGYPLGEHRNVGSAGDALYAELTRVPLFIRSADRLGAADRSDALVQPHDLAATLPDLCGLDRPPPRAGHGRSLRPLLEAEPAPAFDRAFAASGDERRIETTVWTLRLSKTAATDQSDAAADADLHRELFVKPDDWFELSEISNRAEDVPPLLQSVLDEFEQACRTGQSTTMTDLPPELVCRVD